MNAMVLEGLLNTHHEAVRQNTSELGKKLARCLYCTNFWLP